MTAPRVVAAGSRWKPMFQVRPGPNAILDCACGAVVYGRMSAAWHAKFHDKNGDARHVGEPCGPIEQRYEYRSRR